MCYAGCVCVLLLTNSTRLGTVALRRHGHGRITWSQVVTLKGLLGLFMHYFKAGDLGVKVYAFQAMGNLFIARPKMMLERGPDGIMKGVLQVRSRAALGCRV